VSYLLFLMAARSQFDAKILRDLLIPLIFFFLGRHLGSLRSADRLVAVCLGLVLVVGLIEWAGLSTYLRYFDVLRYYVSRGTVQDASAGGLEQGLFISGMRFEGRTLLPALGEHRVSSVFLEPVSVGNFGAIAFAWVLLRDLARPRAFAMKALAIAAILVLGDARFGAYLCAITVALYAVAPLVRPVMIYVAPALAIIALALHAQSMGAVSWENDIQGRFLLAGQVMTSLDAWQVLGLEGTTLYMADSGYAYVLAQFGLFGCAGLWALFAFLRAPDAAAERFKLFVAFYVVFGLCISTSLFTIKTAALLWFLYGTLSAARAGDAAPFAPR
jgi:putative polymerase